VTGIHNGSEKQDLISLTNYPNPFKDHTTISYTVKVPGEIRIEIFDLYGKVVKTLLNETKQAGTHHIEWASDLPSGYYGCRLTTGSQTLHIGLVKIR
jgi:flagellar hook assembly protein FlgD